MSEPRNHHYVPKVYLNAFTDAQKQFWRRKKDETKSRFCTPSQVCYEVDGNTIKTDETLLLNGISDKLHIEKYAFKKQENKFSKSLNNACRFKSSPFIVDTESHLLLISTLLTIKRRNPSSREIITQAYYNGYKAPETIPMFKKGLEQIASRHNIEIGDKFENQIKNFLNENAEKPEKLYDNYLTSFLKGNTTISSLSKKLLDLQQIILHAPVSTQFITSDNPGFTIQNGLLDSIRGFNGEFQFLFPLTPYACLFLSSEKKENPNALKTTIYPTLISEYQVALVNQCTRVVANKIILGKNKEVVESI